MTFRLTLMPLFGVPVDGAIAEATAELTFNFGRLDPGLVGSALSLIENLRCGAVTLATAECVAALAGRFAGGASELEGSAARFLGALVAEFGSAFSLFLKLIFVLGEVSAADVGV